MKNISDNLQNTGKKRQFCTFRLADRLFGLDILDVKEISAVTEFTPIFHAPEEVRGYVNIRGRICLILDMRRLLGYESAESDHSSRLLLFKSGVGDNFGVLVDSVGDVISAEPEQIETRNTVQHFSKEEEQRMSHLSSGVCKLNDALMIILEPGKFLDLLRHIKNDPLKNDPR